jgi:hypothetical protein
MMMVVPAVARYVHISVATLQAALPIVNRARQELISEVEKLPRQVKSSHE